MKKLIILASLLVSTSAFAIVTGDKIEFQGDSAFVSAAFDKSLCLDGDTYKANITKCVAWENDGDDQQCVKYATFAGSQPMASTRQRCAKFAGRDSETCAKWVTVPYVQSPVRTVKYYKDNGDAFDGGPYKTVTITVPSCN